MHIAIITARGGSKRIPRKNIRLFLGKPMIAWPIKAAKEANCFSHILVSTEDKEIAECAVSYGAEVPFLRPIDMADDFTHAHIPAQHMLRWAMQQWDDIKCVSHIYPTAPLLQADDILSGFALVQKDKLFAYTAQKITFPIYQTVIIDQEGTVIPLFTSEKASLRTQDMPQAYIDAGQCYWYATTEVFLNHELITPSNTALIPIPSERAIDIDTEEDWYLAERMAKALFL